MNSEQRERLMRVITKARARSLHGGRRDRFPLGLLSLTQEIAAIAIRHLLGEKSMKLPQTGLLAKFGISVKEDH
jgi:hypothetical protein